MPGWLRPNVGAVMVKCFAVLCLLTTVPALRPIQSAPVRTLAVIGGREAFSSLEHGLAFASWRSVWP